MKPSSFIPTLSSSRRIVLAAAWFLCASLQAQITITRQFVVNQDIPDGGELVNVQQLAVGTASIADVKVRLNISGRGEGGFNGDLYATLGHSGALAVLLNRPGKLTGAGFGYSDSGLNITFDDAAANGDIHVYRQRLSGNHVTPLSGSLTDTWVPDARAVDPASVVVDDPRTAYLSAFDNLSQSGEWRLLIADVASGGESRFNFWELVLQTVESITGTITLGNDALQADGGARTVDNPVTLDGNATFTGANPLTFNGQTTLTGARTLTVANVTTFSGAIDDGGAGFGLTKSGSGTLVLEGNNTYSGPTTVTAGTLQVNGSIAESTVTVRDGGSVKGQGVLGSLTISSGGVLAPGRSPGSITAGNTIWESGGNYRWEINDVNSGAGADPGWDLLNVNGSLTANATQTDPFTIRITSLSLANSSGPVHDFNATQAYTWRLVSTTGGIAGFNANEFNLNTDDFLNALDGGNFLITQNGNFLELSYVPIPEPTHAMLAGALLLLTGVFTRHWKRL